MRDERRHLMLVPNSRPVPRRVGCFMYPPKIKTSSWFTVNFFQVVYGTKFYLCKNSRQSVHKWTSTNTLKFITPCSITLKWRFNVNWCFWLHPVVSGMYTMQYLINFCCSIYAKFSCKWHFRFDGTAHTVLWWFGWAESTYFFIKFEPSQTLGEFCWAW